MKDTASRPHLLLIIFDRKSVVVNGGIDALHSILQIGIGVRFRFRGRLAVGVRRRGTLMGFLIDSVSFPSG